MRNVHILTTDKPSRLWINNLLQGKLELSKEVLIGVKSGLHIYITSDDEIKMDDWVFDSTNYGLIHKVWEVTENHFSFKDSLHVRGLKIRGNKNLKYHFKKIILTTDSTLIAEGVQSINDEFLEWFVKNPKCESVEVSTYHVKGDISGKLHYKIIIPQEEPKQIKCYCGHTTYCDCGPLEEPKQETVQKFIEQHGITEQQLIDGYKQGLQLIFENASKITK